MDPDAALARARTLAAAGDRPGAAAVVEQLHAAEAGQDARVRGECLLELGWIAFGDGDYQRVLTLTEDAGAAFLAAGRPARRGVTVHLAACAAALVAPQREATLLAEALTLLDESQPEERLSCHRLLARCRHAEGRLDEADQHLQQALLLVDRSASRLAKSDVLMAMAQLELERGRAGHCMALADAAREHLATVRQRLARLREAECLELLADARVQRGDRDGAIATYRDVLERMRSLEAGAARRIEQKLVALAAR